MCGVKLVEKRRSQVLKGFAGFGKERQTKQIKWNGVDMF